jgi:hypothetical protein
MIAGVGVVGCVFTASFCSDGGLALFYFIFNFIAHFLL